MCRIYLDGLLAIMKVIAGVLLVIIVLIAGAKAPIAAELEVLFDYGSIYTYENDQSDVVRGPNGALFGTARGNELCLECMVFFEIAKAGNGEWEYSVIYNSRTPRDGLWSKGPLTASQNGKLYGIASSGGLNACRKSGHDIDGGCGTVFELSKSVDETWKFKVIHQFRKFRRGVAPVGGLTIDSDGNLYGVTGHGGNKFGDIGCGTVFRLVPNVKSTSEWGHQVLFRFNCGDDGLTPGAKPVFSKNGQLFGTTRRGGDPRCPGYTGYGGCGTIYRLVPRGKGVNSSAKKRWRHKVVHRFRGQSRGGQPNSPLVIIGGRTLFGTTYDTVFRLSPPPAKSSEWQYKVLQHFKNQRKGSDLTGLVRGGDGNLYGTAERGGAAYLEGGILFRFSNPHGGSGKGKWKYELIRRFLDSGEQYNWPGRLSVYDSEKMVGSFRFGGSGNDGAAFFLRP